MALPLSQSPFSRFGSYLVVNEWGESHPRRPKNVLPGFWLSGVHGFHAAREILRFELIQHGSSVPLTSCVEPACLTLAAATGGATIDVCLADPDVVRVRTRGGTLRLTLHEGAYNYAVPQEVPRRWLLNPASAFHFLTLYPVTGEVALDAAWGVGRCERVAVEVAPGPDGVAEVLLHAHVGFGEPREFSESFDAAVARVAAEFQQFLAPYVAAGVAAEFAETVENAAYLNWSCVVRPQGHFRRPSMLMSKNWMTNVWSWDHALNALALGRFHPELAWDQFMTIFDHQLPTGQLPDFINDAVRLYNYVKPPVHGWVFAQLLQMHPSFGTRERLTEVYGPLRRWTEWWFRFRCIGGDPLPLYYHGNDCGWDNASVFDAGVPARAPDLAAFLVLQMELLAEIATRLGLTREAAEWQARAADLLSVLLARFWNGRKFVVLNATGETAATADSVFGCLPVVLGTRLSAPVRTALALEVRRHLTEWGLATENPESSLYQANGYWRGPIWAPPTLIIVDGLRQIGERELADEIAHRFCALCRQSGFAENFAALTGAPLCDPAYTWTASTFLVFAGGFSASTGIRTRASFCPSPFAAGTSTASSSPPG